MILIVQRIRKYNHCLRITSLPIKFRLKCFLLYRHISAITATSAVTTWNNYWELVNNNYVRRSIHANLSLSKYTFHVFYDLRSYTGIIISFIILQQYHHYLSQIEARELSHIGSSLIHQAKTIYIIFIYIYFLGIYIHILHLYLLLHIFIILSNELYITILNCIIRNASIHLTNRKAIVTFHSINFLLMMIDV